MSPSNSNQSKNRDDLTWEKSTVEKAQKNNAFFKPLYEYYYPRILNYCKSKLNYDTQLAEDLTSITFEKALQNIKGFRWQGVSFSAWIYRIANNTIIDYYRATNKSKHDTQIHDNIIEKEVAIEERFIEYDSESRMKALIMSLPTRESQIIMLKFYDGLTNKEISEKLGISETNTSTIIYRSMQKLKEMLTQP